MKYVYIKDGTVTLIAAKQSDEHSDHTEYQVPDNFDMSKDMGDGVMLDGFLTGAEFLERYNADYAAKRANAYPTIEDQLDKIYHEGLDAWKAEIQAIKDANPKP